MKCVKQWQMRQTYLCTYGILTWSNLKNIDESISMKQENALMSFKCLKLWRSEWQLKKIRNKWIITRKEYDCLSFNDILTYQCKWFQHKKIDFIILYKTKMKQSEISLFYKKYQWPKCSRTQYYKNVARWIDLREAIKPIAREERYKKWRIKTKMYEDELKRYQQQKWPKAERWRFYQRYE